MLKHDMGIIKPGKQAGFTLIELLIVIAIIAILAAIAIPQFMKYKQGAYLNSVRSDIKNVATAVEAFSAKYGDYPQSFEATGPGPKQVTLSDSSGNQETNAVNISRGNYLSYTLAGNGTCYTISGYNQNIASGPGSQGTPASYDSCTGQYSGF